MRDNIEPSGRTCDELLELLSTSKEGLSDQEAAKRIKEYGENKFEIKRKDTFFHKLFRHLISPVSIILLFAVIFTFIIKEYTDMFVILGTLLISVSIGLFQEGKSSKALEKLSDTTPKKTIVLREGKTKIIDIKELVPGDVVILKSGAIVPADMRVISEKDLSVNESALTGEWAPVGKHAVSLVCGGTFEESINMLWGGTVVISGRGRGVVVNTGEKTKIGTLADALSKKTGITPLQQSIRKLAIFIVWIVSITLIFVLILGYFANIELFEIIFTAIAIAIAAIPSGLPAAVTVVLAFGMNAILKQGGLVKNLLAAETLGTSTWILTDKTGTLTEGNMTLEGILLPNGEKKNIDKNSTDINHIIEKSLAGTDGLIFSKDKTKQVKTGSPIDQAIVSAAQKIGITRDFLIEKYDVLDYLPFASKRRYSARILENKNKNILFFVGAPEVTINRSKYISFNGKTEKITKNTIHTLENLVSIEAGKGKRILAIAEKNLNEDHFNDERVESISENLVRDLSLIGFVIFDDPIRSEVKKSISFVKDSNVNVTMVTGDNKDTALHIARKVGIISPKDTSFLEGEDTAKMSDKELWEAASKTKVFARMFPDEKLRLLSVLQANGEVVAMTGDGINDAPSLKQAAIGVALGSGTEVAKEASDLVLIQDNFAVIPRAIIEGRKIVRNLKKIVLYLLSTSFSEVILIGGALLTVQVLPLYPTQILWANIIEEGLMSFAFAFEKGPKDVKKINPKKIQNRQILTPALKKTAIILSVLSGLFLLALFLLLREFSSASEEELRTIIFIALSIDSIFYAFSLKQLDMPIWKINPFDNKPLLLASFVSLSLLFVALFVPFIQEVLRMTYPPAWTWIVVILGGMFHLSIIETVKHFALIKENKVS